MHWSDIDGRSENPQTYSKILRTTKDEYTVFVEEEGREVPLVTFTVAQVRHSAIYIDGRKNDQHIWYNDGTRKGIINQSKGLWISGPAELISSLKNNTMEVSAV